MPKNRARLTVGALHQSGLLMVWAGILILAFAGYQVWFTDLVQQHSQSQLASRVNTFIPVDTTLPSGPPIPAATSARTPTTGNWLGTISGPTIDLSQVILQGTDLDQLRLGPGHYPSTPLPGEAGNVAIAGHRTTWGHPFRHLDQLRIGDPLVVTTVQGRFLYRVTRTFVVLPTDTSVIAPSSRNELTLTTCNPPYSAATRLVIRAELTQSDRSSAPLHIPAASFVTTTVISLNGGHEGWWPIFFYGEILILIFAIGQRWWRHSARRPLVLVTLTAIAVPSVLGLFNGISWLLPAGY